MKMLTPFRKDPGFFIPKEIGIKNISDYIFKYASHQNPFPNQRNIYETSFFSQ